MVTSNVWSLRGKRACRASAWGTMALSIEGRPDRATAIGTIHAALDAGVRYLDTAWSYYLPSEPGPDGTGVPRDFGYGEMLVHAALASWSGPRDEVLVATKTGYRRTLEVTNRDAEDPQQSPGDGASASASERQHLQAAAAGTGGWPTRARRRMIRDAKESALRLGIDALDLLYSHGPDPAVPYEDTSAR